MRPDGPGFFENMMNWMFGEPEVDERAEWKQGREERRNDRHGRGEHERGHRRDHGRRHRDHRPKRREEPPKFMEWTMEEDDYLFMEWQDEMEKAFEEDWSIEMDEFMDEIPEPREPPTVGASHHKGVDMTTLDKRHGGRHLKCRWSQNFGARNGEEHRG